MPFAFTDMKLAHFPQTGDAPDKKTQKQLRLVCKAFNRIVEPRVFSELRLGVSISDDPVKLEEKLSAIASRQTPFTRWTKNLLLSQMLASNHSVPGVPTSGQHAPLDKLLKVQHTWVVRAIEAVTQVEEIQ